MYDEYPPLKPTFRDQLVTYGKAGVSMLPLVGGILGELLSTVVPGQRIDRIADYMEQVETRLTAAEADIQQMFADPEKIDLVEEGGYQAARATTGERIEWIAHLVATGLTSTEADLVRRKRLATLLRQIDDDEVMVLRAYGLSAGGNRDVWATIKIPASVMIGIMDRTMPEAESLYKAGTANLLRLGLIEKKYTKPSRGQAPQFDPEKGDFKHTLRISYLGRMLLREIGLGDPFDPKA